MNESTDTNTSNRSGSRAANLKQRIKQDGKDKIETGKRAAADQIAEIADAIDLAGAQLDQSQPTLANYATQLASSVGTLATRLREDSIEDLYSDMRQLASRHPGMFLLGSAAIGLVAARFMKASAEQTRFDSDSENLAASAGSEIDQDWSETSQNATATPDPYGSPAYGA